MRPIPLARREKEPENLEFLDLHPVLEDFYSEVKAGLCAASKSIPPKFFYDEKGSNLFKQITSLPEYYLTRVEMKLLENIAPEISSLAGPDCHLVEYGCGSLRKAKILLENFSMPRTYTAVDISKKALLELCRDLAQDYPDLWVRAVCADFTGTWKLPSNKTSPTEKKERRVAFFPGSSIGNFEPEAALAFLRNIRATVEENGALVIGVDLKKDAETLNAAYNDAAGVTARFNLNLLDRINRECGGDFALHRFEHRAFYHEDLGRIEMHLKSRCDQTVRLNGSSIRFFRGESIHTENSYKYSLEDFRSLAASAGWRPVRAWTDSENLFSVHYLLSHP